MTAEPEAKPAQQLCSQLGLSFRDAQLIERALTHRSFAFENGGLATNERLEFLGDAVLSVVVTDRIFRKHPEAQEGQLAKIRAAAVKAESLAAIARDIGLGEYVKLGRGEMLSGGPDKDSILADTLEAVIGAVYVDAGFEGAFRFVDSLVADRLEALSTGGPELDYKTSLQELVAADFDDVPSYRVTDASPDHDKTFTATVWIEGRHRGTGTGPSKKAAEQAAAQQAYGELEADLIERRTSAGADDTVGSPVGGIPGSTR